MDLEAFKKQPREYIRDALASDEVPSGFLLDDELWSVVRWICAERQGILGFDALRRFTERRVEAFCKQTDELILRAIRLRSIPDEVLRDKNGWKRICQVRGRNFAEVDRLTWRHICEMRGGLGVPAGPYE